MSEKPKSGVIGSLPRTRPHRRSDKRVAPPSGAPPVDTRIDEPAVVKAAKPKPATPRAAKPKPAAAAKPTPATTRAAKPKPAAAAKPKPARARTAKPKPASAPPTPRTAEPPPPPAPPHSEASHGALETAVQAAAELAEIGLHAGARALRRAVARLPRH